MSVSHLLQIPKSMKKDLAVAAISQVGRKICDWTAAIAIPSADQTLMDPLTFRTALANVKIQQPVNYQYLHKYGQRYWRQPENTQNPKHKETSTNVEATLFTTNKEGTCAM